MEKKFTKTLRHRTIFIFTGPVCIWKNNQLSIAQHFGSLVLCIGNCSHHVKYDQRYSSVCLNYFIPYSYGSAEVSICTIWEITINCLHLYLFTNPIIHSSGTGNLPYIRIIISWAIILHWGRPRDPFTLMNYSLKYLPQWKERSVSQNKSIQVIVDNNCSHFSPTATDLPLHLSRALAATL